MNPPNFGGVESFAPAPWVPPTVNGGSAADATSSILASLYPQQSQQATAPKPKTEDKGNFLTRLLPTGGGLAGGAGGALLGTALLPGIGTVLGGILGAGVGSAGGKVGQNQLEDKALGDDVLREGLLGAGGQAVGGVLGKVAGTGVKKGIGALTKGAENKAARNVEAEALQQLATEFPDAALNAATRTNLGFGRSLDLADLAGIPKTAQGFADASQAATGSNGYLTGVLDNIVRSGGKVDMSNFGKVVEDAIKSRPLLGSLEASGGKGGLPKVASNPASTTKQLFENLLQQIGYGEKGSLTNSADPDKALDLMRQIGKLGQKYSGSATGTEGADLKGVFDTVYKNLKGSIYNRPDIDAAISAFQVGPEDAAAVLKATGGNQQLADYLIGIANQSKRADDLLGPQSEFINMGKAGQKALDYTNNVIGTSKDAKAAMAAAQQPGLGQEFADAALSTVTNGPTGILGALPAFLRSDSVRSAKDAVQSKLVESGVKEKAANIIAPALMGASQFVAHAPNYVPDPTQGGAMQQGQQMPGQQPGGVSPNEQLLQMLLVGLENPLYAESFAPLVQDVVRGPIQQSASANTALQGAQEAFDLAGGGQGMLGGLLSKVGGAITGGPTKTYDAQRAQLVAQLQALGIPTSAIPEVTNTDEAAAQQWATLQNLINAQGAGTGASLLAGVR